MKKAFSEDVDIQRMLDEDFIVLNLVVCLHDLLINALFSME